ncbi:FUSC family protein, partial [Stenotrophomonas maltophilia]|uniref:FUSC family protein n=1 Tax=Stenotrophomonas maltophilia TaxID=40324 RepID=UPI0019539A55
WDWLQLPGFSQAAITVAAVMAVPALSEDEAGHRAAIGARGTHRILGCLIGGLAALAVLALSFESFLPWLIALIIGVWIAAHVQGSTR